MALSGAVNTNDYKGRYYCLEWRAEQSVSGNYSDIHWLLKSVGGSAGWYAERELSVALGDGSIYSKTERVQRYATTISSGVKRIYHDGNGNASFSVSIRVAVYVSTVNLTGSGTFALDTIARRSTISVSDGTLGTAQTITVQRKSDSIVHRIQYRCGNYGGFVDGTTATNKMSYSFTPPLEWSNGAPYGQRVYCSFSIESFYNGVSIGTESKNVWYDIPSSVVPGASVSYSDPTGKAGTYGTYVQGLSTLRVITTTTQAYSSPITECIVTVGGVTYSGTDITTGVLSTAGSVPISVKVTDGRGRSVTKTYSISVTAYAPPKITLLKVNRCDANGTLNEQGLYCKATFSFEITPLSNKNGKTVKIRYKRTYSSDYTEITVSTGYSENQKTYIFQPDADGGYTYDVQLSVADSMSTDTTNVVLSTAFTLMHWNASGKGIGFGKVSEDDSIDIALPVHLRHGIFPDKIISENGVDFNSFTTVGKYLIPESTIVATMPNRPCGLAGNLYVVSSNRPECTTLDKTWCMFLQIFLSCVGDIYIRLVETGNTTAISYGNWRHVSMT